jgi:hypothetical protein
MNRCNNSELITEVLLQLVVKNQYAVDIVSLIPKIGQIAQENIQLSKTINHILENTNYLTSRSISWSALDDNDREVISNFFEYLYFTSPQFLKEVK